MIKVSDLAAMAAISADVLIKGAESDGEQAAELLQDIDSLTDAEVDCVVRLARDAAHQVHTARAAVCFAEEITECNDPDKEIYQEEVYLHFWPAK